MPVSRRPRPPRLALPWLAAACLLLSACEQLGIDTPQSIAAAREADGKAIGGACRNAGRAIEDCFVMNKRADKSAIFAGWRDMNDYMRENNIEVVVPVLSGQPPTEPPGNWIAPGAGSWSRP